MKNFTLLFTALFLFKMAVAQVEKGSIFTGGSFGISSANSDTYSSGKSSGFTWNISPQIGKAFEQHKVIGIQLSAGGNTSENSTTGGNVTKSTGNQFGAGIFYRQYFSFYKKWMFYGQGNANLSFNTSSASMQQKKIQQGKGISTSLAASLGITYQVGKKLWLEAGLSDLIGIGYSHQKFETLNAAGVLATTVKNNNVSANFNLNGINNLAIGFRWILPNKN